jgi:hypothetical protein
VTELDRASCCSWLVGDRVGQRWTEIGAEAEDSGNEAQIAAAQTRTAGRTRAGWMAPTKATSSRGVLMRRISGKRPAAVLL